MALGVPSLRIAMSDPTKEPLSLALFLGYRGEGEMSGGHPVAHTAGVVCVRLSRSHENVFDHMAKDVGQPE